MSSKFCILPFLHMEIQTQGGVYVCCHTNSPEELGNLHENSLTEIWEGQKLQEFKKAFLEEEVVTNSHCQDCFYYEKLGATSWREMENDNWSHYLEHAKNQRIEKPKSVSLRFSNRCNYSCRTCKPSVSTGWFNDAKFLNPNGDYRLVEVLQR